MPKVARRRGRGWEDEMAKAVERDRIEQHDKAVAAALQAAAAADAKKRTGKGFKEEFTKLKNKTKTTADLVKHWNSPQNRISDGGYRHLYGNWYRDSILGATPVSEDEVRRNTPGTLGGRLRHKRPTIRKHS